MSDDLPMRKHTLLLRAVFETEVSVLSGEVSSTAFEPPRVEIQSTAFTPKGKDCGLLSTEHEDRPGGAGQYLEACGLSGVAGIWAVSAEECKAVELPVVPDGHLTDRSDWHISIDFRGYMSEGSKNVNGRGKRKAKALRGFAVERGQQA